jgi:hypothetical protein
MVRDGARSGLASWIRKEIMSRERPAIKQFGVDTGVAWDMLPDVNNGRQFSTAFFLEWMGSWRGRQEVEIAS